MIEILPCSYMGERLKVKSLVCCSLRTTSIFHFWDSSSIKIPRGFAPFYPTECSGKVKWMPTIV